MPPSDDISKSKYGTGVHKPRKKEFKGKRAVRACDTCRRLKTRCILSPIPNEFHCLRCESLKIHCSFQDMLGKPESRNEEPESSDPAGLKMLIKHGYGTKDAEITSKLLHNINNNVHKVLEILEGSSNSKPVSGTPTPGGLASQSLPKIDLGVIDADKIMSSDTKVMERFPPDLTSSLQSTEHRHVMSYLTSPYVLLSQMVSSENLPIPVRKIYGGMEGPPEVDDLVTINLITLPEALLLMSSFRDHYGAWCSFPVDQPIEELVESIRSKNGSLLLTTACVLALRYTDRYHDLKVRVYKNLLYKLKSDLQLSLSYMPQTVEFLQAIVILSLYSSSFSSDIISLDAWYLSGIGIQQYITKNIQESLETALDQRNRFDDEDSEANLFTSLRIWNHLCLVHLTHCVFSGRMCVVDEIRLDLSRRVLQIPKATNFDGRMVGEIALELILYNFMQQFHATGSASIPADCKNALEDVKEELKDWLEEWDYFFTQPITQFLEFAYHYGYSMIIYSWYHRLYHVVTKEVMISEGKVGHLQDSKTSIGSCLNEFFPVERIIESMPSENQLELLLHCHTALREMAKTELSVFKYLSDQIVFRSVLLSLFCIEVSSCLRKMDKNLLPDYKVYAVLTDIKIFSSRLQKIREGELKSFWVEEVDLKIPSVILQYHKAIENCLQSKFPSFENPTL